jgi:hypothetical protein
MEHRARKSRTTGTGDEGREVLTPANVAIARCMRASTGALCNTDASPTSCGPLTSSGLLDARRFSFEEVNDGPGCVG